MRNLKRYLTGDDVWEVKQRLVELGYLEKATHKMYGNDTYKAVKTFQSANGLEVDGIVGDITRATLFSKQPEPSYTIPEHISKAAARLIAADLALVSETRRQIVLEALERAVEPDGKHEPKGFYIRGANAYNTDLSLNTMTLKRLNSYFKKTAYKPYYDNGREEWMRRAAEQSDYTIIGADCSGFIVGLWRKAKVVKATFDAKADWLYNSGCIATKNPMAGDLCWKSGHIGLYCGGGYVAEAAGGAYGIQLTQKNKRVFWDYVAGKKTKTQSNGRHSATRSIIERGGIERDRMGSFRGDSRPCRIRRCNRNADD